MPSVWRLDHPVWQAPHRSFFLLAGLWAALVPIVWLVPDGFGPEPLSWHRHELLFGMGGAAVGGYLLTALPAWTGGAPVPPTVTRLFVVLWLAGRFAFAIDLPPLSADGVNACYFLALGGFLSQKALKAKAWHRVPLAVAPLFLGGFALLSASKLDLAGEYDAMRVLPLLYGLLVSLVGGRAVPAFTLHWMRRNRPEIRVADPLWMFHGAILAQIAAIVLLLVDLSVPAGVLLILSGMLQFTRILAWRSWRTPAYPALLLLHLAWFWLPSGLVAAGVSLLPLVGLGTAAGLHVLTMGAMGTMMLAIMGRAAMVRREQRLLVSRELALAFALVFASVPTRLCLSFAGDDLSLVLHLSAVLWSLGWMLFLYDFRHALQGPVPRPVLSAAAPDPKAAA